MNQVIDTYHSLLASLPLVYSRALYQQLSTSFRIVGIIGARGVGKTTYLLDYLRRHYPNSSQAVYISADSIFFAQTSLFEFAQWFVRHHDGQLICIDEIHRYPTWAQELKNIYDTFPQLKIIFSGSSTVDLIKEKFDLSRRVLLKQMPGFSFREYLEITLQQSFPQLTLDQLTSADLSLYESVATTPKLLGHFQTYLQRGYYPFAREIEQPVEFSQILLNVVDKVIESDISSYYQLKTSTLPIFKSILHFIATTPPGEINASKLARNLQKDYQDVAGYLDMMKEAGLLRYVLNDRRGYAHIRNAHKVFISNPNLALTIAQNIGHQVPLGTLRELFATAMLQDAGYLPLKPRQGDLKVESYTFEIGGKNKGGTQLTGQNQAFLLKDDLLRGNNKVIPLYALGLLY